jgi:hypothetical protein
MKKNLAGVLAVSVAALLFAGCGNSDTSEPASSSSSSTGKVTSTSVAKLASARCERAAASVVATIADGLTGGASIAPGSAVTVLTKTSEQSSTSWPKAIVAVKLTGGGSSGVAVWAVNSATDPSGLSPISSISSAAKEWSNWGAAAQPGSQAAKNAETVAGFEASKDAEKCAKAL